MGTVFKKSIVLFAAMIFAAGLVFATGATAQEKYPSRPVDFICTWGVGGGADQMARMLGRLLEKNLGVAVPVSNKPGASGNAGITDLLAGKADGYTIAVYIADTLNTIPNKTARHTVDDLEWIVRTQVAPSYLFVKPDGPFKTIEDLFKFAKENPGKLKVGTTGFGTVEDWTVRYLGTKGYKMNVIPVPNPGERYAATLGGHNEVLYEQAGDVKQYLDAKQLKPLIIFAEKRQPAFADVPCSVEMGFQVTLPQFRSIVAKKGTPPDRLKIVADAIKQAMDTPEWKKFAEEQYVAADSYMGPDRFPTWVREEIEVMNKYMKEFSGGGN